MDSSQKKLELLRKELTNTAVVLKVASQRLLGTKATQHPIFIAHTDGKISYGIEIIDGDEHDLKWSIRLATLEDFIDWQFIPKDRTEFFKETYKSPVDFACIFLASQDMGKFIFYPFPKDET